MNPIRAALCFLMPPLAVLDRGPGPFVVTLVLTVLGWIPGVVCALVYSSMKPA